MPTETELVRERYARRKTSVDPWIYSPLNPSVYMDDQERARALIHLITSCGLVPLQDKTLLDIGCGEGPDLLLFLQLGFEARNLTGIELLEDSAQLARQRLPSTLSVHCGDAASAPLKDGSFDVVFQSMVFSSLLDDAFQRRLADRMWSLVRPGGGVIWYDFVYDNPRNPDVRGVPVSRVRSLFPEGDVQVWRVTLAPPISRAVTRIAPWLYGVFNALPFLRTHRLCWIQKAGR